MEGNHKQPWEAHTSLYNLTLNRFKFPESPTYYFDVFCNELAHRLLEKEVEVGGNMDWEWPNKEFEFESQRYMGGGGISISISEAPQALRPLTLRQVVAIVPLLREWCWSKPDTGLVPTVRELTISLRGAGGDAVLSSGEIHHPIDFPKDTTLTSLRPRESSVPSDPYEYQYGGYLVRFSDYERPSSDAETFQTLVSSIDDQISENLRAEGLYTAPWPDDRALVIAGPLTFLLQPPIGGLQLVIAVVDSVAHVLNGWAYDFGDTPRPSIIIEVFSVSGQVTPEPVALGSIISTERGIQRPRVDMVSRR